MRQSNTVQDDLIKHLIEQNRILVEYIIRITTGYTIKPTDGDNTPQPNPNYTNSHWHVSEAEQDAGYLSNVGLLSESELQALLRKNKFENTEIEFT